MKHSFGSDNHSGVAPDILDAIIDANLGFYEAYGDDDYTKKATTLFKEMLGENVYPHFVINGTGANITALKALTEPHNAILCPNTAHINVDECGAPERFTGCKLISIPAEDGKVSPKQIELELKGFGVQHHSQIKVLSISQPTELGTLYSPQEISELVALMHSHNCYLHIDGSRISNASAALGLPIRSFISDLKVDALSFGGTKNGLLMGEAVLFFQKEFSDKFQFIRKQASQLYSKNRFVAAQFIAYLSDNRYLKYASHANQMAHYLASQLTKIPFVKITRPVSTNAVFAIIPKDICQKLQQKHSFYVWDELTGEVRWMCSFNTKSEDIDQFIEDLMIFC